MTEESPHTTSSGVKPIDFATVTGDPEDLASSGTDASGATAAPGRCDRSSGGTSRRRASRRTLALRSGALQWRKHYSNYNRLSRRTGTVSCSSCNSPADGTASQSNNQLLATSNSSEADVVTPETNLSDDSNQEDSSFQDPPVEEKDASAPSSGEEDRESRRDTTASEAMFLNLEVGSQSMQQKEPATPKSELANVIEKAILDFCSSRTVETMRRMFAGATSEMEALQGEAGRQGDKSVQAPHPVTGELVKEGIVIGSMDVFAPRVHREYRLEMKDSLVEGFMKEVGVFRSICYRTKCQLEVTRRLLNKKVCTGGRWVKYLIVRIVGPSLRAISCCDQLLQKAVPAFKYRIEYPRPAYCRLFFREDIPDNTMLYHCYQRTGGTSNRYGSLRLETPYRLTAERTIGNCPWKSGALRVGKLSFAGSGSHLSMQQVYPGYGYLASRPVEPESKGSEAVHRIDHMHSQFLADRQLLLQDRRVMTIPVCR